MDAFHTLIQRWFRERFESPTPPQQEGWLSIVRGEPTLIAAPTGSGKTLAAFLWSIDRLFKRAISGELRDQTTVVYVSPLKALGNDIAKNLQLAARSNLSSCLQRRNHVAGDSHSGALGRHAGP